MPTRGPSTRRRRNRRPRWCTRPGTGEARLLRARHAGAALPCCAFRSPNDDLAINATLAGVVRNGHSTPTLRTRA
jgi:hypothetical protein